MTKKKRTAAQFFDDAETHGLEPLMKTDLNSDKVSKHLESGTKINYNRMLVLWDERVFTSFHTTTKHRKILTVSRLGKTGTIEETLVPALTILKRQSTS